MCNLAQSEEKYWSWIQEKMKKNGKIKESKKLLSNQTWTHDIQIGSLRLDHIATKNIVSGHEKTIYVLLEELGPGAHAKSYWMSNTTTLMIIC